MGIDDALTLRPLPPRDQWGRYRIRHPETNESTGHQRMTTFVSTIQDEHAITEWRMRCMLAGIKDRPDLYALARSLTDPVDEQKKQANDIVSEAITAGKVTLKANTGTAYHQFTETIDDGGWPKLTEDELPDMVAYQQALDDAGFEVIEIETICVNFTFDVGGTLDRLLRHKATGAVYIGDLKTGAQPHRYPHEICMQLAGYAHAECFYRYDGGDPLQDSNWHCEPAPKMAQNKAVVIHLVPGSGKCQLYWFDIGKGWEMFPATAAVRNFRKTKATTLVKPIMPAAVADPARIAAAPKPLPSASARIEAAFPGAEIVPVWDYEDSSDPAPSPLQTVAVAETPPPDEGPWQQTIDHGVPVLPTDVAFEATAPIKPAADTAPVEFGPEGISKPGALAELKTLKDSLNWDKGGNREKLMKKWLQQGTAAGCSWRLTEMETIRRSRLYWSMIRFLEWYGEDDAAAGEDTFRAVYAYAMAEAPRYGQKVKVGELMGGLDHAGASILRQAVTGLCVDGKLGVTFDAANKPVVSSV